MKKGAWKSSEIREMKRLLSLNMNLTDIAKQLDRSYHGVTGQMKRLRESRELTQVFRKQFTGPRHGTMIDDETLYLIRALTPDLVGPVGTGVRIKHIVHKLKELTTNARVD